MRRPSGATGAGRLLLFGMTLLALLTVGALLASFERAWADSGGWPTATATFIVLPTIAPTWPPLPATLTPLPPAAVIPTLPFPTPVDDFVVVETPAPSRLGGISFCWPFALAFLVVVIIAGLVFVRRRSV
jgi:hypothetical protein